MSASDSPSRSPLTQRLTNLEQVVESRFSSFEAMLAELKVLALKGPSPVPNMVSEQDREQTEDR